MCRGNKNFEDVRKKQIAGETWQVLDRTT
jgi:hypothetical protein